MKQLICYGNQIKQYTCKSSKYPFESTKSPKQRVQTMSNGNDSNMETRQICKECVRYKVTPKNLKFSWHRTTRGSYT